MEPNLESTELDQQFLSQLKQYRVVLVDFFATWCEPCNQQAPLVSELAKLHQTFEVDVDVRPELAKYFNVNTIPTIIVFENGVEKTRFVGVTSKEAILQIVGATPTKLD